MLSCAQCLRDREKKTFLFLLHPVNNESQTCNFENLRENKIKTVGMTYMNCKNYSS